MSSVLTTQLATPPTNFRKNQQSVANICFSTKCPLKGHAVGSTTWPVLAESKTKAKDVERQGQHPTILFCKYLYILYKYFLYIHYNMEFNEIVRKNLGTYVTSFYLAIKHEEQSYLIHYLDKFMRKTPSLAFVFYTLETCSHTHKATDGEHYHFLLLHKGDNEQLNKKITNSLMRHFVNKYNLAGNSEGTRVRQYGLIQKRIRSVANICRYVTKGTKWETPFNSVINYRLEFNRDLDENNSHLSYKEVIETLKALPKWDDKEDDDTKRFFLQTLEEIKRQPLEIKNNEYSLIQFILRQYDLAKKHPPVKATIQKYLRIVDYTKLSINDFIDKYYLNNNYNASN